MKIITKENMADLFNSVFLVTMEYGGILGRKGTAFYTIYKDHYFLLSAAHCVDECDLKSLCVANYNDNNPYSIPINKAFYPGINENGMKIGLDIVIMKIDEKMIRRHLDGCFNFSEEIMKFCNKIKNMPFLHKIQRKAKGDPLEFEKLLSRSKAYQTLSRKDTEDTLNKIPSSLLNISPIHLSEYPVFLEKNSYEIYGFPTSKSDIKYNSEGKTSDAEFCLCQLTAKYTGICSGSKLLRFTAEQKMDYDGFSGAPIICDGRVVAMVLAKDKDGILAASVNEIEQCLKRIYTVSNE